jgi:hypothetical protein
MFLASPLLFLGVKSNLMSDIHATPLTVKGREQLVDVLAQANFSK